jgi:DNA-binding IclR family transcriptional regulator
MFQSVTPYTAVTAAQLQSQLDADRAAGLAWSDGNYEAGISSVAAAIFDATNMPIAALNVSGHSADFAGAGRRAQISKSVKGAALEISQRLGWLGADFPLRPNDAGARAARSKRPAARAAG